jgi:hypothetical protein
MNPTILTKKALLPKLEALYNQKTISGLVSCTRLANGYAFVIPSYSGSWKLSFEEHNGEFEVHMQYEILPELQRAKTGAVLYEYQTHIESLVKILAYVGFPVYRLDAHEEGQGFFILGTDNQIHGVFTDLHMDRLTTFADGCQFVIPGLKERSELYKKVKKAITAAKGSIDMLVTADTLADITGRVTKDKYDKIAEKANVIHTELKKKKDGHKAGVLTTREEICPVIGEVQMTVMEEYVKAMEKLAKAEDKINVFMYEILPTCAGLFKLSTGSQYEANGYRYPTLRSLQELSEGRYGTAYQHYYSSRTTPPVKNFVRGVERIGQFIKEDFFKHRKVNVYSKDAISKMV